jgi:predicted nucleic acid-binding protein
MPPTKTIYWDACIFIAWIKGEKRPNNEMDGVFECVAEVEKGRTRLITSVVTRTEVFEADLSLEVKQKYADLLNRRSVQLLDNDLRVSNLAREIREYYDRQSNIDGVSPLTALDAIHLATAIHYKVDAFWTFDDGGYGGRSLLSLNGNVAGYPLVICKPVAKQLRLGF